MARHELTQSQKGSFLRGNFFRGAIISLLGIQAVALGLKALDDRRLSTEAITDEQKLEARFLAARISERGRLVDRTLGLASRAGTARGLLAELSDDVDLIITVNEAALSNDPRLVSALETRAGFAQAGVGLSREGDIVVAPEAGSGEALIALVPAKDWLPEPADGMGYTLIGDSDVSVGTRSGGALIVDALDTGAAASRDGGRRSVAACQAVPETTLMVCSQTDMAMFTQAELARLGFYVLLLLGPALALFGLRSAGLRERSDKTMADSESRTRTRMIDIIMRGANAGQLKWTPETGQVELSAEAARLLGTQAAADIDQDTFLSSVLDKDSDKVLANLRAGLESGHVRSLFRTQAGHGQAWLELRLAAAEQIDGTRADQFVGILLDVSEQQRTENRLKSAEYRLRSAIEGFNAPFALWDARRRLLLWNKAFAHDFKVDELIRPGMSYDSVWIAAANAIRQERTGTEGMRTRELWLRDGRTLKIVERPTPDGGMISFGVDITSQTAAQAKLLGQQEKLTKMVGKLEHSEAKTTELARKYAEEKSRAERASEAKSSFLANVSHELRTPLNAINGFSEMIANEMFGPIGDERYRDYAKDILQSGQHLLDMINDILDMAKIEAGKMTINPQPIDPVDPVDAAVRMMRHRAEERGVRLTLKAEDLPLIEADHRAVRQMLLNLLSNAIKFTPEGGRVAVGVVRKGDFVRISVRDTGIGIAKDDIPRLARPFEQVHDTTDRKFEGTGLGLALTKSFAEMHNGRMSVASEPGKGTLIAIYLPVPEDAPMANASAAPQDIVLSPDGDAPVDRP